MKDTAMHAWFSLTAARHGVPLHIYNDTAGRPIVVTSIGGEPEWPDRVKVEVVDGGDSP